MSLEVQEAYHLILVGKINKVIMAHYVTLDENNIVISGGPGIDEDILLEGLEPELFYGNVVGKVVKRTSYNTNGGIHYKSDGTPSEDQTKAFRKNYAGLGYSYDEQRDAFIPPKPYPSWILDEFSCLWDSPIPYPDITNIPIDYQFYNGYVWNEINYYWELRKPYNSWILHEDNYYISPVPYPNDGNNYYWDEDTLSWIIR